MNYQLLLLILGASVALAELQMDFPRPPRQCQTEYDNCISNAGKKPCGKVSCEVDAIKCARKNLPSPPPNPSCKKFFNCVDQANNCKAQGSCLVLLEACKGDMNQSKRESNKLRPSGGPVPAK
ncbi:uncharacterized protein [Pocillopora verrucosa]|uniref:uncharacterized protein LOC113672299 n=1 Tax=Pocillopora damicornis TaxID=46731 RepID=UPI000F552D14|nr:uncharacterized protein LOC113672299 [Pocillopora damicornis]